MKTINKISISFIFITVCLITNAQSDKSLIRQGNHNYKNGNYQEAEVKYKKSLDKKYSPKAQYNLGDALYEQKNYEEAAKNFSGVTDRKTSKKVEANSHYNLGNSLMRQEKYGEAFNAYKKSLKINPDDEDARYNLEYARWKMIQQQQQNKNNQKQKQEQQQKENHQEQQQKENHQEQQQNQQMSKEDAERMLQALENQEKKIMENINEKKASQLPKRKIQKDW